MTKEEMFKEMEKMAPVLGRNGVDIVPVSYTHLDVYKRQEFENVLLDGREHGKLVDSLGDTGASEYIERLSVYLAQTGRCLLYTSRCV